MPFTILFAIAALILLVIVFGVTYKLKGAWAAALASIVTLVFEISLFFTLITAVTRTMAN